MFQIYNVLHSSYMWIQTLLQLLQAATLSERDSSSCCLGTQGRKGQDIRYLQVSSFWNFV